MIRHIFKMLKISSLLRKRELHILHYRKAIHAEDHPRAEHHAEEVFAFDRALNVLRASLPN